MTDEEIKAASPHAVVETAGVAYDPSTQYLDLTKDEKRRTTALMMAIQAYKELIIKDADMLREVALQSHQNPELGIRPATIDAMLDAAWKFDLFIFGKTATGRADTTRGGGATTAAPSDSDTAVEGGGGG